MTATQVDTANRGRRQKTSSLPKNGDNTHLVMTSVLANTSQSDEAYSALVEWLQSRSGCAAAGFFIRDDHAVTAGPNNFDGPAFDNEAFLSAATKSAEIASRTGDIHSAAVERIRNLMVVSVPVQIGPRHCDSLTAALVIDENGNVNNSSLLNAATNAALWHSQQRQKVVAEHLQTTAAAMDLLRTLQSAETFRSGCISLVNTLRTHLQCRGVVLGLTRRNNEQCTVAAMSGMADFDTNAVMTQTIKDALDESLARDRLSTFPCDDPADRDALLSHKKLRHDLQATRIVSHPLCTSAGETVGAWLVIEDSGSQTKDAQTLLRTAAPPIAETLRISKRADRAFFSGNKRTRNGLQLLLRIACGIAVAAAILMIPLPYQIHCDCAAEPDVRRFIVAPHEGLIEKTFVEPGDVVQEGQLLARMDGRDVRWELAGLAAEQERAKKDEDAGLLMGDVAAAQRAALELQQLNARQQILTRRRNELELKSPISGIVLDGHLDRVENAPVNIGQALYEVAPLAPVTVEVAIPDDEHAHVDSGFEVTVRFDGVEEDFTGTIQRIHARSEVLDGNNVFIAEVVIENNDERLRPGMSGYARIKGNTKSLGWSLFHKPWEHLQKLLPF